MVEVEPADAAAVGDEEAAVRVANRVRYGLVGSVFTVTWTGRYAWRRGWTRA